MARQYSTNDFLRRTPNKLLKRYFETHGDSSGIPWQTLDQTEIEPILQAINDAPKRIRDKIESDFREVELMADDGGIQTLMDEAAKPQYGSTDLPHAFGQMASNLERAFWAFMEYPEVFQWATRLDRAERLRYHKRLGMPGWSSPPDDLSSERLADALSEYYSKMEGRGLGRKVDYYQCGDRHYWFAFLEDFPKSDLTYNDNRELKTEPYRPAFEVIFRYHEGERSLEINAKGGKKTRGELQKIFSRAILGVDIFVLSNEAATYVLDDLLDPEFELTTDPADGISSVRITELKLGLMGRIRRAITLQAGPGGGSESVYGLLADILAGGKIPKVLLTVIQVGIQFIFDAEGNQRKKTLSFRVSYPNSCSLRNDATHELAKEYLKRWQLDRSGHTDCGSPEHRPTGQHRLWK